ncbi:hypothetical protein [Nonomuraea sp. NPDC023979]|uniref:hypothetical protein n=1 Tax=Nonomuraea sp. NPDC023979 TaxID=3154796 RepID=UPI0033DFBFCC
MSETMDAVRWQVTITCRWPPRVSGYEDDTFHFRPDRLRDFYLSMQPLDDFELTFTTGQVRLRFTYLASTKASRWYVEGPLRNSLLKVHEQAAYATTVLATVLGNAYFEIEGWRGSAGPDTRLPGPVRVQVVELSERRSR